MTATYPGTSSAALSANQTKAGEITISTGAPDVDYADGPSVTLTVPAGCDFVLVFASVEIGAASVSDCRVGLESTALGTPDLTDNREQLLNVPFDGDFGADLLVESTPVQPGGAAQDKTSPTALGFGGTGAAPLVIPATPNADNTFSLVYQNSNPLAGDAAVANRKLYVWLPADFA